MENGDLAVVVAPPSSRVRTLDDRARRIWRDECFVAIACTVDARCSCLLFWDGSC
jgi:hypothetical protein